MTPSKFASKAVNQYRSRDIFGYLALRYYLEGEFSKSAKWVEQNAVQVVLGSPRGRYFRSWHFKSVNDENEVVHREIFLPSPSEALVEAYIINECASYWNSKKSPALFSYYIAKHSDKSGYFQNYVGGLRARQRAIADACRACPDGDVRYIDIKKFYPSISPRVAQNAWNKFCNESDGLKKEVRTIGSKLIANHALETEHRSILTGPMFSHFVANLVLHPLDKISASLPAKYVRYVDDITLVGQPDEIAYSLSRIEEFLGNLGLHVHEESDEKSISISATKWLDSEDDFQDDGNSKSWMKLVGSIKKHLIFHPEKTPELESSLLEKGFRFPLNDYDATIQESTSFEKIKQLGLWTWLFRRAGDANIGSITERANQIRDRLQRELTEILANLPSEIFERKRQLSKIRYRIGRLAYLSSTRWLESIEHQIRQIPELRFHAAIVRSIVTNDVSEVISLGTNVSQSVAQIFRASLETAKFPNARIGEVELQGIATFIMNGVSIDGAVPDVDRHLLRIALGNIDVPLLSESTGFIKELACLHGLGTPRHASTMRTAFDPDQEITLDALKLDYGYSL
jgi:hypothetical protein